MKAAALLPRVRALVADRPSDADLLQAFVARRDDQAFAALVRRHGPLVLSAARRGTGNPADADDVFQATFLLLARNAASVRNPAAVGGWLHGVASRMARTARRAAARRRSHETRAIPPSPQVHSDLSWREVQSLFEEELARLPDRFRVPFVLCTLNGEPRGDVARRLGIKEGTISSRLAEARRRLQGRLSARGVSLAVLLGAVSLPAALSADLIDRTLNCTTSSVPAGVSALVRGGGLSARVAMLAVALTLSVGVYLTAGGSTPPVAPKQPAKQAAPVKPTEVRGKVLDADGNPLANVPIRLWSYRTGDRVPSPKATTDAAGTFRFEPTADDLADDARVVATPDGRPAQWLPLSKFTGEQTLQIPHDDVPLTGRVASLENQALPGVTVQVIRVSNVATGEPGKWLDWNVAQRRQNRWANEEGLVPLPAAVVLTAAKATTDAAGKFKLTGFGRDRVLSVRVSGPNVETKYFWIVSRPGGPADGYIRTPDFSYGLYGPDVTVLLAPARPLVGTVRDKDGNLVVGAVVSETNATIPKAVTDKDGRYRLEGVPKKPWYGLNVAGVKGVPIFDHTHLGAADSAGLDPLETNLTVTRGIELVGRVVDADGKPVRAEAMYFPPADKDQNLLTHISSDGWKTKPDGSFFVTAHAGKGVLLILAREANRFAVVDPGPSLTAIKNRGRPVAPVHAAIPLDLDPAKPDTLTIRVQLEPSRTMTGTVVGPDGEPLSGASAVGLSFGESPKVLPKAEFTMTGPRPGARRLLIFVHEEKKLAAVHPVSGDAAGPLTVRLAPVGSMNGRVMKSPTEPGAGFTITAIASVPDGEQYDNLPNYTMKVQGLLGMSRGPWRHWTNRTIKSDKDGRFTLDGLLPGLEYTLYVTDGDLGESGTLFTRQSGLTVEPGKALDLGTLSRSGQKE